MADFPPLHPGELLREEFMKPLGLSNADLARALGVSRPTVGQIVNGQRGITPDMAARLAKAFSMSPRFWLNVQLDYELEVLADAGDMVGVQQLVPAT